MINSACLYKQIEDYIPFNETEEKDKLIMLECLKTFNDVLSRNNKICHFTSSAWIVNKDRTKVLMVYHNTYHSLAWVGGHADGDANLLRVAMKEIEEETGLKNIRILNDNFYGIQVLGCQGHFKNGEYVSSHLHLDCCFLVEAFEEDKLRIKRDENSDVDWFNIEDAISLCTEENMVPIYQKLIAKMDDNRILKRVLK